MSIPSRLFMGALSLLKTDNSVSIKNAKQEFYVMSVNDFFTCGHYTSKISNSNFPIIKTDDAISLELAIEISERLEKSKGFINLANLNTIVFLCKEDKNLSNYLDISSKYFLNKVKESQIDYFTPLVISNNIDLNDLANRIEQHINSYIISNSILINSHKEKFGTYYDTNSYLNIMAYHKCTKEDGMKFIEAFISVYMYGIGSINAFIINEKLNLLQNNYTLNIYNKDIINIDFTYFHIYQDWDKKTIQAYKVNPNLTDYIESFVLPSKRLMLNFTNEESFFTSFKGYFLIQLFSQIQIEPEVAVNLCNSYFDNFITQGIDTVLYCNHVIRSFPETDSALLYDRTINCANYLYEKMPEMKPIYSLF